MRMLRGATEPDRIRKGRTAKTLQSEDISAFFQDQNNAQGPRPEKYGRVPAQDPQNADAYTFSEQPEPNPMLRRNMRVANVRFG